MFARLILVLFFALILQGALGPAATAQSSNCPLAVTIWYWPDPVPQGFFYVGPGQGPFSYLIGTWNSCASPAAPAETCPFCPRAGSPISLATGNTFIEQTDIRVPGLSNGLNLVRTWNSAWPTTQPGTQIGLFGPDWRCNFEERVFQGTDNFTKYARGDGSFWSFQQGVTSSKLLAPANITATLTTGPTYWTIAFQNGEQRRFDNTSGNLIAIIDRNGNQTQLSYTSGKLSTVTDPVGRHLYFSYTNASYPNLVTSVTSDIGITLSYSYDAQGRISQITKPDLTTISFAYNAQSLITSVTDGQGKVLESHTYDSAGRGLTSSQANGVNAVTVLYQ